MLHQSPIKLLITFGQVYSLLAPDCNSTNIIAIVLGVQFKYGHIKLLSGVRSIVGFRTVFWVFLKRILRLAWQYVIQLQILISAQIKLFANYFSHCSHKDIVKGLSEAAVNLMGKGIALDRVHNHIFNFLD